MTYSRSYLKKLQTYTKTGRTTRRNLKNTTPNKFEQSMYDILEAEQIKYEREYNILGTSKWFDCFLPEWGNKNILLEFDGDYWHVESLNEATSKMQIRNWKNDRFKDKLALKYGYKLIRIRQSDNITSIKALL